MCYPQCEEPFIKFMEALEEFKKDLHSLLVFKQPLRTKYQRVFNDTSRGRELYVYVQRQPDLLVKVAVYPSMGTEEYLKDPVDIWAEDAILVTQLEELSSVATMRENMEICREIVHEDQVLVKLKYGDLNSGIVKFT